MTKMIWMAGGTFLQFAVFLALGSLVLQWVKRDQKSLTAALVTGYFSYFGLFELVCLPMVFLKCSLTLFTVMMTVILAAVLVAACMTQRKWWVDQARHLPSVLHAHAWMLPVLIAVVAFQCYAVAVYWDGSADAAYYVSVASTSVYTDSLGRYNPLTGALMKYFRARYVFSCYPLHNAYIARLTGLPAIVQAKTVMSVINVLVANLIYYRIGRLLFAGKNRKYADLMVVFLFLLNLFCNTIYLPGAFLFQRIYEGKSILANLVLPMVFYCSVQIYQKEDDRAPWILLFLTGLAAVTFSGSSLIVLFAGSAVTVPVILFRRRFLLIRAYLFSILPILCWGFAYFLTRIGVLVLRAS